MSMNKKFNLKYSEVCGLDIGSSAVKLVALRKSSDGYTVTAAGISQIPKPQNNSQAGILKAIEDCIASAKLRTKEKFKTKLAVCSVSGPEVAIRDFKFPPLPEEEVEGAVFYEASLVCPFSVEQASVDYQLFPNESPDLQNFTEDSGKIRGILVAATNSLLATRTQLVKEAGLKCVLMDIDGLALLNCFHNLTGRNDKTTTAILNVGGSCTTLAIMSKDGWPFIRDINYAGDHIINAISQASQVSSAEIINNLFNDNTGNQAEIDSHIESACGKLACDVSETLRFYAAGEKATPVDRIFACGGFAPARGFIELLSQRLGVEVSLWNPFDTMQCSVSERCRDICTKTGPAMAVATGLAMRSINTAQR
jgi:type IV pilus assembly protein PilM